MTSLGRVPTTLACADRVEKNGSKDAPIRHFLRPTSSSASIRLHPSRVPQTPPHRSRSRSPRQRRHQELASPNASEHGYHSPWSQTRISSVKRLLEELTTLAECSFTEEFFRQSIDGATEHVTLNVEDRNITSLLCTMAGALASLRRDQYKNKALNMEMQNKSSFAPSTYVSSVHQIARTCLESFTTLF